VRYLLDTNTVSYAMGERREVLDKLARLDRSLDVYSSTVTEGELLFGALRIPEPRRANLLETIAGTLMSFAEVAEITRAVAGVYADVRVELESRGQRVPDNDLWIAAIAIADDFTLVSHDDVFARIPNLKLEDWLA
jgi:tRNA(fMet)-specific endonuclease VapC